VKEQQTTHDSQSESRFERRLGLTAAVSVGLGTMIGAGIFVLSANAAAQAGPAAVISFVVAGAVCVLIAMNVSELATAMPQEGGSYHLISRTLGPIAGAVVGPANWLGLIFAGGFYLIGFGQFMEMLTGMPAWIIVVVTGIGVAGLNYWGTGITGKVQRWVVGILIVILLAFVVWSLFKVERELYEPFAPEGWGTALGVVGLILVSFTGFEKISTVAEEIRRPGRNLPLAIIGSVVIATVLYALVLFVFTGLLPWQQIEPEVTALIEVSGDALGPIGYYGMLSAGLLATLSSANAATLASSRICFAMGRDRILPEWLGVVHEQHGTPHRAILLTAALSLALGLSGAAAQLAEISSALFIVSYALISVGVLAMRKLGQSYTPPFRVPLYPWLPALGGLAALAVLATMELISLLVGLGLTIVSLIWYFVWARSRTEVKGTVGQWVRQWQPVRSLVHGRPIRANRPGRHIVLGFTEKEQEPVALLRLGRHLAASLKADLDAVCVRFVPESVAISQAWEQIDEERNQSDNIPGLAPGQVTSHAVEAHIRPARSLAHGILGATETLERVEFIMLAGNGSGPADAEVRRDYGGDVVALYHSGHQVVDPTVLRVGVSQSAHARLSLRLASALARASGARIELVRVTDAKDDELANEDAVRQWVKETINGELQDFNIRMHQASSVAEGLTGAADGANLLLLGAGKHTLGGGRMGPTARQVVQNVEGPVLVVWKGQDEKADETA
jgi:basic amino acid/polyamine antiporter, APA family